MANIINQNGQVKVGFRTPPSKLLDIYTGTAATAYSLRRLSSTYTGSAIRVRRSSDNVSQDIGFDVNGDLDTTALTTFVGSNNKFYYSEDLDNAHWSKNGVTITPNAGIAPDGTQTADLFTETATSTDHYFFREDVQSNLNVGGSWNMSFYVKKSPDNTLTENKIMLRQGRNGNTSGGSTVVFNLETGNVDYIADINIFGGSLGVLGASMSDEGNGWWRCSMYGKRPPKIGAESQSTKTPIAIGRVPATTNGGVPIVNAPTYQQYWNGNVNGKYLLWGLQITLKNNDDSYQELKPYSKTTTTLPGSGFVTVWYDQSGNNMNISQTTAANQPSIIEDSTLITLNGKPIISFLFSGVTRKWLGLPLNSITLNRPFSIFLNMKIHGSVYEFPILSGLENNRNYWIRYFIGLGRHAYTLYTADNNLINGEDIVDTNQTLHFMNIGLTNAKVGKNGSTYTKNLTTTNWKGLQLGLSNSGQFYASEMVLFNGDVSSDRNIIESNINTYYTIY